MLDGAWTPSGLTIQINVTTNWKVLDVELPSMDLFSLPLKGKALFDLVEPFDNLLSTDATTNWSVEEAVCLKDKALLLKTDAATNLNVAEDLSWLIWFIEVTGSPTNDAKVLHETFVMKVTGSRVNNAKTLHETVFVEVSHTNPVWEWTQQ